MVKFIPNLSQATSIINELKSATDFEWLPKHDAAFDMVCAMVAKAKLLHHPDFSQPFTIQCDASNNCVGAMLFQQSTDNRTLPIEFMSKKLVASQLNWHSNEKECFAVLTACKKWYKYLVAAPFTVLSDHKNFEILLGSTANIKSGRVQRWAVWLQSELNFVVRHIAGADNIPSDYLSRDILHGTSLDSARSSNSISLLLQRHHNHAQVFALRRSKRIRKKQKQNQKPTRFSHRIRAAQEKADDEEQKAKQTHDADIRKARSRLRITITNDTANSDENADIEVSDAVNDESAPRSVAHSQHSPIDVNADAGHGGRRARSADDIDSKAEEGEEKFEEKAEIETGLQPLLFEDPELKTLIDRTNWTEYLSPVLLKAAQDEDILCKQLKRACAKQANSLTRAWKRKVADGRIYTDPDGILMFQKNKILIPACLRPRIIEYFHDSTMFAHQGLDRMQNHIRARFWWPGLSADIVKYIRKCRSCRNVKVRRDLKHTEQQLFPSQYPFHMVAVDLVSFPGVSCLSMIDRFSRYAVVEVIADKTSKTVIAAITRSWIHRFGVPERILSDNGPEFSSAAFEEFCIAYGIVHLHTTPYHPQTNGMLERLHRTLKQRLVSVAQSLDIDLMANTDWTSLLSAIVFSYNNAVTRMTGYSPHELIFNRAPKFPIDLLLNLKSNDIEVDGDLSEYVERLAEQQRAVFLNSNRTQAEYDE